MKRGRTLVIGGGIGGLTAAARAQKRFEATIIERSDGRAIATGPAADRAKASAAK